MTPPPNPADLREAGEYLLILLFVLLLALLLNIKLWLLPLFLTTFIFFSSSTHDDYSFLVGLSLQLAEWER